MMFDKRWLILLSVMVIPFVLAHEENPHEEYEEHTSHSGSLQKYENIVGQGVAIIEVIIVIILIVAIITLDRMKK